MESEDSAPLPSIETLKALQLEHKAVKEMTTEERLNEIKEQLSAQMQGKKRVVSKSPVNSVNDLRWQLQQSLNKLNVLATRDAGVKAIRRLIDENASAEMLNLLLSNLREQKKTRTSKAREQEVLLVAYLASVYRQKLVDEGATPLKTLGKVANLVHLYFKDLSREVHEAAGTALSDLYVHCYPKTTAEAAMSFLLEPLTGMLTTGADVQMQHAAAYAVYKWTFTLAKRSEVDVLTLLYPKVVGLFLKLRPEYPDLISALGILMDSCGFEKLIPDLISTLSKLVQYVLSKQTNSQVLKLEACKFLKVLPDYLKPYPDLDFESLCQDVLPALVEARADKQPEVQIAASRAYQEWRQLVSIQENIRKSQEKVEASTEESTQPAEFRPLTAARAVSKVKKEWEASPDLHFKAKWGVSKPQILEKGSGKYGQIKLGSGKVDVLKALASRASIRELVANRIKSPRQNPPPPLLPGLVVPRTAPTDIPRPLPEADRADSQGREFPRPMKRVEIPHIDRETEEDVRPPSFGGPTDSFPRPTAISEALGLENAPQARPQKPKSATLQLTPPAGIDIRPRKSPLPVSTTQVTQTSISRFATTGTQYEAEEPPQVPEEAEEPVEDEENQEELREIAEFMEQEVGKVLENMVKSFEAVERRCEEIEVRVDQGFQEVTKIREKREKRRKKQRKMRKMKKEIRKIDSFTQTICEVSVQTSLEQPFSPIPSLPIGISQSSQTSPRPCLDKVSQMWLKALNSLSKGQTSESFRQVLGSGDDLYLLRLLLKTGLCMEELEQETREDLLERLGLIAASGFLAKVGEEWLAQEGKLLSLDSFSR